MYTKEINFNDYVIAVDYDLSKDHTEAKLLSYAIYKNNTEINIPCVLEAEFIQKRVDKELDRITLKELHNMLEDYEDAMGDLAYDRMVDK